MLVPLDKISARGSDMTPLHTLPLKCAACGGREVTLFAIDSQAELVAIQQAMAGPREPAQAPTTHARSDPDAGLL